MIKRKMKIMVGLLSVLLFLPAVAFAADTVVSADWLQANLSKVTIVDIRKVEDYNCRSCPGSHQRLLRRVGHSEGRASQRTARR